MGKISSRSWEAKAALQRVFSSVPFGHRLNYQFQRRVTHGLPISAEKLETSIGIARRHLAAIGSVSERPIGQSRFFEFGAGWDLHVPQCLYCHGVEDQLVVDLRPLAKQSLVFDIATRLHADTRLDRAMPQPEAPLDRYLRRVGIEYRAPCDAGATGLSDGSIDCITSTSTLEHCPPDDIRRILDECRRIITDGGAMSFCIDYRDHYSYFDRSVTPYNFLRFDDQEWRRHSPSLHFQNRLRHSDYVKLLADAGLHVVSVDTQGGTPADETMISEMELDSRFESYSLHDLAVREAWFTVAKAPRATAHAHRASSSALAEAAARARLL